MSLLIIENGVVVESLQEPITNRVYLKRDALNFMRIMEHTSSELALLIERIGANDYDAYVQEGGVAKRVQTASMKDVANGIAGLDASTLLALTQQRLNFKLGTFSRDMTAASGNVAYTGVGFQPRVLLFFGAATNTHIALFFGATDGVSNYAVSDFIDAGGKIKVDTAVCIRLYELLTANQSAVYSSFDADGFTLTWTKVGAPSANTATMFYLALR